MTEFNDVITNTKSDKHQKQLEHDISYICFTYVDLQENMNKQFNLDKAIAFFSLDEKIISYYQSQKFGNHPLFRMTFQCVVCSDKDFETRNLECTNKVKNHWKEETEIASEVSRYVIKLNITEELAQKLYEEKKYSTLAEHIIGKREDKITESNPVWELGDLQKMEENLTQHATKNDRICRVS